VLAVLYEMTYRFRVRGPLPATDGSPLGARQYWEMTEGTLRGDRIDATIAMPGGDWHLVGLDRFGRPDVRVQFVTQDGAPIFLHYTGLVERTVAFNRAADSGGSTGWDDQYMRMFMTFDTGAERYAWLNQHLFLARGRLAGPAEIEYEIYRVL
jgi:Protein of unknown function (DUF3237)